jgi:multiple sugar transport system permease protein
MAASPSALPAPRKSPRRISRARRREMIDGYLFLLPWIIGFVLFVGGPMVASFLLSFTAYDVIGAPRFVGLDNFIHAFTRDRLFWPSLGRTFYYAAIIVPIGVFGSMLLAILLNQAIRGKAIFRTLFFLPHLTPIVATAVLWMWIFQPKYGLANYLLDQVGIDGPAWLSSTDWAIPALIIMALWRSVGGDRMMIFLAGLQGIPQELYEAAEIDGAGRLAKFRNVTLPMLSPTVFFNLVLSVIAALKVFTAAYVATQGGPAYATWFYALHIFTNAFQYYDMGYASALAWLFLVVMLVFTLVQFRSSSRWVYYAGEERR